MLVLEIALGIILALFVLPLAALVLFGVVGTVVSHVILALTTPINVGRDRGPPSEADGSGAIRATRHEPARASTILWTVGICLAIFVWALIAALVKPIAVFRLRIPTHTVSGPQPANQSFGLHI
jgi:hypothetical protein